MTELTDTERERLAEPMYAAYRLGKYAPAEYLPMWHELDQKPTSTPEHEELYAVVGDMLAAARAEGAGSLRTKIGALADDFHDRSQSHAWPTPSSMAYRDAWRTASTVLRALLADGGEPNG